MRRVFGLNVLLLTMGMSHSAFAVKFEAFETAASAAAHGWAAVGNGLDSQIVGWSNSNDAGGAAGEAQVDVKRGALASYADSNLGMVINGSGGFSIAGKLNVVTLVEVPDLGNPPILGFFNSSSQYLGLMFRGDFDELGSDLSWGLRFSTTGDGIRISSGGDASRKIMLGTPHDFSLVYDPAVGSFGTLTVSVSGAGDPIVHALSETNRDLLNGAAFNMVGVIKSATGADANGINLRLDDLTYTGVPVPEPSSLVTGFIGLAALAAIVWRKRDRGWALN